MDLTQPQEQSSPEVVILDTPEKQTKKRLFESEESHETSGEETESEIDLHRGRKQYGTSPQEHEIILYDEGKSENVIRKEMTIRIGEYRYVKCIEFYRGATITQIGSMFRDGRFEIAMQFVPPEVKSILACQNSSVCGIKPPCCSTPYPRCWQHHAGYGTYIRKFSGRFPKVTVILGERVNPELDILEGVYFTREAFAYLIAAFREFEINFKRIREAICCTRDDHSNEQEFLSCHECQAFPKV